MLVQLEGNWMGWHVGAVVAPLGEFGINPPQCRTQGPPHHQYMFHSRNHGCSNNLFTFTHLFLKSQRHSASQILLAFLEFKKKLLVFFLIIGVLEYIFTTKA